MGLRDAIRALLDGDETDDTGEIEEIERGVAEAVEGDGDEGDGDEGDGIGESGADEDEEAGDEGEPGDEDEGEPEGTPGDESEDSPEVADLRATIIEQAEQIEALRNRLAAAGLDDEIADSVVADEITEDEDEDLVVSAFEDDYAKRQAALAEITEN